jgi:mono/diheme cytochrome c family protein
MPRLTARERREGYLREHAYQKATGKAFFPRVLLHDTIVNLFFVALMIALALIWYYTSSPGPNANTGGDNGWLGPRYESRADPAVESYDPRPEWYFYFLFELLRIFSNPNLILLGTIIVPTIFMILLIGMPFIDRARERRPSHRPIALGFASGMAILLLSLTWYGSKAPGAQQAATDPLGAKMQNLQCTTCHTLKSTGWNGNIGPNLDSAKPTYAKAVDRLTNGKGAMPSFKETFGTAKIECVAAYVSSITNGGSDSKAAGGAPKSPNEACAGVTLP